MSHGGIQNNTGPNKTLREIVNWYNIKTSKLENDLNKIHKSTVLQFYKYIYLHLSHLADTLIQSDLQ